MFRIEMLPAAHGDCLWIEYGKGVSVHRILIDGGPAHAYPALRERLLHLPAGERRFDLLVVTHVDCDHIDGIIRLLQDAPALGCRFERIWFNGRDQLNRVPDPAGKPLGGTQGEYLSLLIQDYEASHGTRVWNLGFEEGVVAIGQEPQPLPSVNLEGDCRLTLLSPDPDRLLALKDAWDEELRKAKLASGDEHALRLKLTASRQLAPLGEVLGTGSESIADTYELPDPDGCDLAAAPSDSLGTTSEEPGGEAEFGSDESVANGSSIALLLEYPQADPEVRFLLSADAWPGVLEKSLKRLGGGSEKPLLLTGLKVPHHGSVGNLTESFLARLSCTHYLISTSGAVFRHPHARSIELILDAHRSKAKPRLHFNYLTETTAPWSNLADQKGRGYEALHPRGISLEL